MKLSKSPLCIFWTSTEQHSFTFTADIALADIALAHCLLDLTCSAVPTHARFHKLYGKDELSIFHQMLAMHLRNALADVCLFQCC